MSKLKAITVGRKQTCDCAVKKNIVGDDDIFEECNGGCNYDMMNKGKGSHRASRSQSETVAYLTFPKVVG